MLAAQPGWIAGVKGDLQLHSVWSDGSASVAELAATDAFIRRYGARRIRASDISPPCAIPLFRYSGIHAAAFITTALVFPPTGREFSRSRPSSIRQSKSTPIRTGRI